MWESFFGFKTTPFSDRPDTKQLFASQAWHQVKTRLEFLAQHHGVGLVTGEVGAGKSTALALCAGFADPSTGTVRVLGLDPRRQPEVYRRIGIVHDRDGLWPFLTARELVELMAGLRDVPDPPRAAAEALASVGLEDAAERRVGGFSKGMRQRTRVAAALVHDPAVLLLDEPFNGLDPEGFVWMRELLRSLAGEGRAVLVSSHLMSELQDIALKLRALPAVDSVETYERGTERLSALLGGGVTAAACLALVVLAAVVSVVSSTMRLLMQQRRIEIEVLKLVGATDAAHGDGRFDFDTRCRIGQSLFRHLGFDHAGPQGNDADSFLRHFLGEPHGEGIDGALARGIVRLAGSSADRARH